MKKAICTKAVKAIVLGTITVLGIVGVAVVMLSLPTLYTPWMWLAPVVFILTAVFLLRMIDRFGDKNQRQILNGMMIYKSAKLAVCMAVIFIFFFSLEGNPRNGFLILFMVDFLIMTVLETFALSNFEKANKLKSQGYDK